MKSYVDFNKSWGDPESNRRIEHSDKGTAFHQAEISNHLSSMAQRFERSPNRSTTDLWAKDIAELGYKQEMVAEICRSIPFKFVKYPSLAEIMELLRPYLPKVSEKVEELDHLTHLCIPHIKERFLKQADQGTLDKMVEYYKNHVFPEMKQFSPYHQEMCVLGDWMRSYFGNGSAIVAQGKISNEAKDKEYFTRHYRQYAKEHKLI